MPLRNFVKRELIPCTGTANIAEIANLMKQRDVGLGMHMTPVTVNSRKLADGIRTHGGSLSLILS